MSRARWLAGQLAGTGLLLGGGSVAFGLVFWWWAAPFARAGLAYDMFTTYPPAQAGWTLLSLSLAVYFSILSRSALGAARWTIVVLVVLGLLSSFFRGYLLPTATIVASSPKAQPSLPAGADFITYRQVLVHGQILTEAVYQPLSRFWALQFADCAVLLVLAALVAAASFRAIRRAEW